MSSEDEEDHDRVRSLMVENIYLKEELASIKAKMITTTEVFGIYFNNSETCQNYKAKNYILNYFEEI